MNKKSFIFKSVSLFIALCVIIASLFLGGKENGLEGIFPSFAPAYFKADTTKILDELTSYYAINQELTGWINNKNDINICVMKREDNEFYLSHSLTMANSQNGTAFMDNSCDENSLNTVIYGNDTGIFSPLWQYSSREYVLANPTIEYSSLYEKAEYKIYAVIKGSRQSLKSSALSMCGLRTDIAKQEFDEYVNAVLNIASIKTQDTPKYGDKLITLCTYTSGENSQCIAVLAYAQK